MSSTDCFFHSESRRLQCGLVFLWCAETSEFPVLIQMPHAVIFHLKLAFDVEGFAFWSITLQRGMETHCQE